MDFEECRIYRAIDSVPFHKVAAAVLELTEAGRDVSITDDRGQTFLHHVAIRCEKFQEPRALPAVYQLLLAGVAVDAAAADTGDTALHVVARAAAGSKRPAWRVLIALLRFGADTSIKNKDGKTALDLLLEQKTPESELMQHWYQQYTPGIYESLQSPSPSVEHINTLLDSYCRTWVVRGGKTVCLEDMARSVSPAAAAALVGRRQTTELALAVLAGSAKRTAALISKGGCDADACDVSHQTCWPHTPRVPQPLLAAAWEQESEALVEALMEARPDTGVLYSNLIDQHPKPLFFHLLSGAPKPSNLRIVHRILKGSDLTRRNRQGQTVLYEAMKEGMPVEFIKALLRYGVDVAARDEAGRTAREYAQLLEEPAYVQAMDEHVLGLVQERQVAALERLVVTGYTVVTEVVKADTEPARRLASRLQDDRSLRDTANFLLRVPVLQRQKRRLFLGVDGGSLEEIEKFSKAPLPHGRNKCGHSLLHRALLSKKQDMVRYVVDYFPHTIDMTDNMMRGPLHYAVLLYGLEHSICCHLTRNGANPNLLDVYGKRAADYDEQHLTTYEYQSLLREVTEFESRVYLREMQFEEKLLDAVKRGSLGDLDALMKQAAVHVPDLAKYSHTLFSCVDSGQPDIAEYLIRHGANPAVWNQYEEGLVSLHDRAVQAGFRKLADYIAKKAAATAAQQTPMDEEKQSHAPNAFDKMEFHNNVTQLC